MADQKNIAANPTTAAAPAAAEMTLPEPSALQLPNERQNVQDVMERWKLACSMGKAYSMMPAGMLPGTYSQNFAACTIACDMAIRLNASPIFVMQNLYVVHGMPSWSGKSCKALIDNSGIYAGRSTYELAGQEGTDDRSCRLVAVDKLTGKRVVGTAVSIKMAKDSGWWDKNGSYWPKITEQMLRYRAAAYFARSECPEVLMGANIDMADTPEEVSAL